MHTYLFSSPVLLPITKWGNMGLLSNLFLQHCRYLKDSSHPGVHSPSHSIVRLILSSGKSSDSTIPLLNYPIKPNNIIKL